MNPPPEASARNDGKRLERETRRVLELMGFDVSSEELIGSIRVDMVARGRQLGEMWIVGVECKDHAHPLTKKDFQTIWLQYEELHKSRRIDQLLVVARVPPSAAALAWAKSHSEIMFRTIEGLQAQILDFREYLGYLESEFERSPDRIADYYVPLAMDSGHDLETEILKWIDADPKSEFDVARPVAILAAYGSGKSSFATKLASGLARRAIEDSLAPIPVLIRLADMTSEQSLSGLLGTHFTATNKVGNYSFNTLMELARQGRFVFILDGFDEMRQVANTEDFRHNLRQLARLGEGSSRLVLLGRPTAFESDDEQRDLLHRARGEGRGNAPAQPLDYQEIGIAAFSKSQILQFLDSYARSQLGWAEGDPRRTKLIDQVSGKHLGDLAKRPVQLRMLAQILPDFRGDVMQLDVKTLYDKFIDRLLIQLAEREEERYARLKISPRRRRAFLARLAYLLWTDPKHNVALPDELVQEFAEGRALPAVRRDLVTGAPIDRGSGDGLRFPPSIDSGVSGRGRDMENGRPIKNRPLDDPADLYR